jgi:DNA-binding XRE family transcriptional regulator
MGDRESSWQDYRCLQPKADIRPEAVTGILIFDRSIVTKPQVKNHGNASYWQALSGTHLYSKYSRPNSYRSCKARLREYDYGERKKERLAKKGWKTGSVAEFLVLSAEESACIEIKLALSEKLRERRRRKKLTQAELAKAIESSQSRVAKMEAGDPTVSIDLLVKSLLALGVSKKELGRTIS